MESTGKGKFPVLDVSLTPFPIAPQTQSLNILCSTSTLSFPLVMDVHGYMHTQTPSYLVKFARRRYIQPALCLPAL